MKKWTRAVATAVPALAAVAALAGPAAAQPITNDACARDAEGYGAPGACQLLVQVLEPECIDDVPYLHYAVLPQGTANTRATLTWVNPGGDDVVLTDLPLEGTVLWPGVEVDGTGKATDWPGWTQQADGTWTEGDEFSWTRPGVQVVFEVNPQVTATAMYPGAAVGCAGPVQSGVLSAPEEPTTPQGPTVAEVSATGTGFQSEVLAATGAQSEQMLLVAGGLLVLGGAALGTRTALRRRTGRS